ncbi:PEP-CTERM sorting domain-containing protein [Opitutaceae bacterium TAV4]|nr:PEP-CTERM sorting domain-containing protein [Opitutaceae bacterium TAV4]RRK00979.1 PEP-CTERM sorting domain-containing protein [Opitutaceae bacterium TAV3]
MPAFATTPQRLHTAMNKEYRPRRAHRALAALLALALPPVSSITLHAQATLTWDAGGANDNWSTNNNWNPNDPVSGNHAEFGNTGKGDSTTTGNYIDQSVTIESLSYIQTVTNTVTAPSFSDYSNNWQVTYINPGVTLTISPTGTPPANALSVGRDGTAAIITNTKIQGEGALVVNAASSKIWVNNPTNSTSISGYAILDLAGLSSFTATVDTIEVGTRSSTADRARSLGLLTLAADNTITTNKIIVGSTEGIGNGTGVAGVSKLQLGRTNEIFADEIYIGAASSAVQNRSSGELSFQTFESGPTPEAIIRAKDGVGRANLTVGKTGASSGTAITGTADFTGGKVDALLNELVIGSSITAAVTGTLRMAEGTIDATIVRVGYSGAMGSTGQITGTLDVAGGDFIADSIILTSTQGTNNQPVTGNLNISGTGNVTVNSNLTLGSRDSSSYAGALVANVAITGGSLTVNGNIAEGTNPNNLTSTITLAGGMLDLRNGTITNLTNFNLQSGTLKNLAEFNGGAALVKTTDGTLEIEGDNAYTGGTQIEAGALHLVGILTSATNHVSIASGAAIVTGGGSIAGNLTLDDGATLAASLGDAITVTGNVVFGGDANLALALAASFTATLGDTFSLLINENTDAITGAFATINGQTLVGDTFSIVHEALTYEFQLSYTGDGQSLTGGNDIVVQVAAITAVPEPSTVALFLGFCASGFIMLSRRHR